MSASSKNPLMPVRAGCKRRAQPRLDLAPEVASLEESQRLRSLLECLRAHAVPLQLAVPLLMRMRGDQYSATGFTQWQGISRQYLTMLLHGIRPPNPAIRAALTLYVGVDPFASAQIDWVDAAAQKAQAGAAGGSHV